MVINGSYCGANRRLFYVSWVIPLVLIIILVIYSVKEILGFNGNNGVDRSNTLVKGICERNNKICDRLEYCCEGSTGTPTCCPQYDSEEVNRRSGQGWHRSLGFWNMWYFWLAIILMLAFCFTGCSYWRRRRQLAQLQQLAGWTSTESTCPHPSDPSLMVPFTMYEVPPEALLRFMQENSYRTAAAQIPQETSPPSYNEVASKPEMYPVPVKSEAVETGGDCPPPPAYESIPHSDALHPSNGTASTEESHTASASRTPPPTTLSSSSIEASDQATSSNGN